MSAILAKKAPTLTASSLSLHCHQCFNPSTPSRPRRHYASIHSGIDSWPSPAHPNLYPTPYQILNTKKGTPYDKSHFCDLVKLYHPDRTAHTPSLSPALRLERYHLLIAAHTLLSDPEKRKAYDLWGAGWSYTQHPATTPADPPRWSTNYATPGSPMGNATWEDWERWYAARDGTGTAHQGPVFLSNGSFVSLVIALAALGGLGQLVRAENAGQTLIARKDEVHDRTAKELARVKKEAAGWSRDERIMRFLRQVDPEAYANEGVRRLIVEPDICDGGDTKEREFDLKRKYR